MREDRTPGGKHRHGKRHRPDDSDNSINTNYMMLSYDTELVQQLLESQPDRMPSVEGRGLTLTLR